MNKGIVRMKTNIFLSVYYKIWLLLLILFVNPGISSAQFYDTFDEKIQLDQSGLNGWNCFAGDGEAIIWLADGLGSLAVNVDATHDKEGIWWAIIKRDVTKYINVEKASQPDYEIRLEARVKLSHAPRRINLSINTQRTTDFHTDLSEFDINDTENFHTISYTTKNFDVKPGDKVMVQMALIDWGLKKYKVDVDYYKVEVVNINEMKPDLGVLVPYHPEIAKVKSFSEHLPVSDDAMINPKFSDYNFNSWYATSESDKIEIITVNDSQYIILKWDLSNYKGHEAIGSGLLSLTTQSVQRSSDFEKDFGMIRVSEILGGDPDWKQENVTYNSFCDGQFITEVVNTQMIIDVKVEEKASGINYITISQPVLQRMLDGQTKGIAVLPLGAINASFFASESKMKTFVAQLHFNSQK